MSSAETSGQTDCNGEETSRADLVACPLPATGYNRIVLGHGSGGRLSSDLVNQVFLPGFDNAILRGLEDQASFSLAGSRFAFTTDGFVVRPLYFPGGDIGQLAICGTVNDLAVGGAKPAFISAAFILEEGFAIEELQRIVHSMRLACDEAGVKLVAGDTKVVDRGKGDQVFITTSGIGIIPEGICLSISAARPGDKIVLSGSIGDHGMSVMSVREGLEFESELRSDCASLNGLTELMLSEFRGIRCMRDPTRGGLATALNELASASRVGVKIDQQCIPIKREVAGACEILGLDALYVANEGKLIAVVEQDEAEALVKLMRTHPHGKEAVVIGQAVSDHPGLVTMKSIAGGERLVTMLAGEQLPRIC